MSSKKLAIAVLVSGNGTNLQAIIDAIESKKLNAEIRVVISNNPKVNAISRCKKHNIPVVIHDHASYESNEDFEKAITQTIIESGTELVCLAGFMRILSNKFVARFKWKIINIHPSLLPSFPGLHAQKQALDYGARVSGCTVHFVDDLLDNGPIILQSTVTIEASDTEETLSARILKEEHKAYPTAIKLFAEGRLKIEGRRVLISF